MGCATHLAATSAIDNMKVFLVRSLKVLKVLNSLLDTYTRICLRLERKWTERWQIRSTNY